MNYIYSTCTAGVAYTFYEPLPPDSKALPVKIDSIVINGGSNVADKKCVTPRGVVTEVSDEQLERLESHPVFQLHKKNGFVTVEKRNKDIEKVIENMEKEDKSAPETPEKLDKKKAKPQL